MIEGIRLFLVIATCYRMSYMVTKEDGPLGLFYGIRETLATLSSNKPTSRLRRSLAYLFHCPFCLGVWFSAVLSLVYFFPSTVSDVLLVIFGVAGAQHFAQSIVGVGKEEEEEEEE